MKQIRILISRPDRIGDVVLSTPIPRAIKTQYPDSYIAVLLRPYTKDIYLNNPYVDEIILYDPYDPNSSFLDKIREIRKHKFSHALMLLPNEKINYMLFLAGIKNRVGTGHKFYQFITGVKGISRNKYIPLKHEADYCMDLARAIGIESNDLTTEIYLTSEEVEKVTVIRKSFLNNKKYVIGIHTGSGNSAPNWKPEEYARLLNELSKDERFSFVVTDNEIPLMLKNLPDILYPNVGRTLRESILNFASLDLLISASTGPMHIAAALKIKTLSMFCPLTACSPELWGPKGNEASIILPDAEYCSLKCPGDPKACNFSGEGGIGYIKVIRKLGGLFI